MLSAALKLTADGSYTLSRGPNAETYHSTFGAVTESEQVFLRNSDVRSRLTRQLETNVLEIGFGTGLNFMLTAQCAKQYNATLAYTGFEVALPDDNLISQLLSQNTSGCEKEIIALIAMINSNHKSKPHPINQHSELVLVNDDALDAELPPSHFHAVYLDAFSHREAPALWENPFLKKLFDALKPNGELATYSVNRPFKNALNEAGFSWQKLAGPPGKREVIVASKSVR